MSLWGKTDAVVSLPKFLNVGQVRGAGVTTAGTNYSQGVTLTFAAAPGGGTTATGTAVIKDGKFAGVTITNQGAGYTVAPTVTITKPTAVTGVSATGVSGEFTITVGSATGVYVGMGVTGTNIGASAKVTAINALVITLSVANTGAVSASNIAFTDNGASAVLASSIAGIDFNIAELFFIDETEAQVASNKAKGMTAPGWWKHKSYQDVSGNTRYKSELLVALATTAVAAGDTGVAALGTDDATVADANVAITISVQPADQNTSAGAATFAVTASNSAGTLTYQWQVKVGTANWTNVGGATASSIVLSGKTSGNTGDQYRVVIAGAGAGAAAKKVTSNAATLTFVS